jgi:hypothetical protein
MLTPQCCLTPWAVTFHLGPLGGPHGPIVDVELTIRKHRLQHRQISAGIEGIK